MPKSWRTGMILHLTTWLPTWIPWEMNFQEEILVQPKPPQAKLAGCQRQLFELYSNAENGRQPSRGDKEPNVFHRYSHTVNEPGMSRHVPDSPGCSITDSRKPHHLRSKTGQRLEWHLLSAPHRSHREPRSVSSFGRSIPLRVSEDLQAGSFLGGTEGPGLCMFTHLISFTHTSKGFSLC